MEAMWKEERKKEPSGSHSGWRGNIAEHAKPVANSARRGQGHQGCPRESLLCERHYRNSALAETLKTHPNHLLLLHSMRHVSFLSIVCESLRHSLASHSLVSRAREHLDHGTLTSVEVPRDSAVQSRAEPAGRSLSQTGDSESHLIRVLG